MKTNLHGLFQTSNDAELNGVWFDIGNGAKFRVRRFGGKNSQKVRRLTATHHKPFARMIELGTLPEDKEREIYIKIFIEACLVCWEGIKDGEGKDLPFTNENAMELFKTLPELFDALVAYSSEINSYKSADDLGNS